MKFIGLRYQQTSGKDIKDVKDEDIWYGDDKETTLNEILLWAEHEGYGIITGEVYQTRFGFGSGD